MPLVPPTIKQVRPSSRPSRGTRETSIGNGAHQVNNSILDLENRLDLDGDSSGKATHADRASRPDPHIAENLFHQIGIAVDDLWWSTNSGVALTMPKLLINRATLSSEPR